MNLFISIALILIILFLMLSVYGLSRVFEALTLIYSKLQDCNEQLLEHNRRERNK